MTNLDTIRQEIDYIDQELVTLLEKRMQLVNQVATYKKATGKAVLDTSRETAVLQKVANHVENKAFEPVIRDTFVDIMKHSRDYQAEQLNDNLD